MDLAAWQDLNGRYLAASVEWLRLRLEHLSPPTPAPQRQRNGLFCRTQSDARPAPSPRVTDQAVAEAARKREEAAKACDPLPALLLVASQFGLSPFERDVLMLCLACELDTRVPLLCAQARGNGGGPHPSFALALAALDDPAWNALSPQAPLRHWRLIETAPVLTGPLVATPLRVGERVLHYIKGLNILDTRLAALVAPVDPAGGILPPSQEDAAARIVARWSGEHPAGPPVALLLGNDSDAKLLVAHAVAAQATRRLFRLDAAALPAQAEEVAAIGRLWQLESALSGAALYVDGENAGGSEAGFAIDRMVADTVRAGGMLFYGAREPPERTGFDAFPIALARPLPAEQDAVWREAMAAVPDAQRDEAANRLTAQFSLNAPAIHRIVAETPVDPVDGLPDRLWDACRDRLRPRVGGLAMRVDPVVAWDDLVVNDETARLLHEIVDQVRERNTVHTRWAFADRIGRGLGITALFSGESGTGKTYAAEAIASALRLPLYRIDLSQVVNKYIGETEKNLQRLFDQMEGAGAILFFDEADALFGKRSEVRDSHDRYANIEVNYLLQRMENYSGLAILATNMKGALDPAFIRRLRFIVPFGFPGPAERRQLWEKVFPAALPVADIDHERLARLSMTGANIRNVALNAAFLAASERADAVTTALVLRAARAEFRKMDRPVNEGEFRP